MTREQQREYKRQKLREQRRKEREAWEAARGPFGNAHFLHAGKVYR